MMVVSVIVGLASGLAAALLKISVHYVQHWIADIELSRFSYPLFPTLGLLLTTLVITYLFKRDLEKGIAMVLKPLRAGRHSFRCGIPMRISLPVRLR